MVSNNQVLTGKVVNVPSLLLAFDCPRAAFFWHTTMSGNIKDSSFVVNVNTTQTQTGGPYNFRTEWYVNLHSYVRRTYTLRQTHASILRSNAVSSKHQRLNTSERHHAYQHIAVGRLVRVYDAL